MIFLYALWCFDNAAAKVETIEEKMSVTQTAFSRTKGSPRFWLTYVACLSEQVCLMSVCVDRSSCKWRLQEEHPCVGAARRRDLVADWPKAFQFPQQVGGRSAVVSHWSHGVFKITIHWLLITDLFFSPPTLKCVNLLDMHSWHVWGFLVPLTSQREVFLLAIPVTGNKLMCVLIQPQTKEC